MITKGINNVVTHNGSFHADDVFACATLYVLLNGRIRVTRTRETELIEKADVVFDVVGVPRALFYPFRPSCASPFGDCGHPIWLCLTRSSNIATNLT